MYLKRDISTTFFRALKTFPSILITGPRQSGKTTFLKEELGEKYHYITFDDPLERQFALSDPNAFLNRFTDKPVILDEIQYVPELFSYLKMRIDNNRDQNGWWVMTGSQQFELMKNISDSLAGRIAILELPPFNYIEVSRNKEINIGNLLWNGGYPSLTLNPESHNIWLKAYIQTYIERDVRLLQQIRDIRLFEQFLGLYAANHGKIVNHTNISKSCGISQPTVKEWEAILEASFIIRRLIPFYNNLGKRIIKSPKVYFYDSALVSYLTRHSNQESILAGPMGGEFFEGWVITEAYKCFAAKGKRADIFFWRSNDGLEVDLIIEIDQKIHPIEIKQTATPTNKHSTGLLKFKKLIGEDKCGSLQIVCSVEKPILMPNNVTALPWSDFPQWLNSLLDN